MTEAVTRVHCPWCTTRLNAQAAVCHRCGAIKMRPPLSMMQIFFVHPLGATVLALAGLVLFGLSAVKAGGVFIASWLLFSLIHVAFRQRRRWVQLEPLLLKADETEQQVSHAAPFQMKPWFATAATVIVGVGIVWAATPHTSKETASAAVIPVDAQAAPVTVATVAPPREALPPTPPAQPWKAETPPSEPLRIDVATVPVEMPKPEQPDRTQVLTAQRLLSDLGYDVGGVDGKVGARTRAAIKSFREKAGLGGEEINAELIAALETAAPMQQFAAAPAQPMLSDGRPARLDTPAAPSMRPQQADAPIGMPTRHGSTASATWRPTDVSASQPTEPRSRGGESTATLNRESAQKAQPAPQPRPERTAVVTNEIPVNGTMASTPREMQAPVRLAAPTRNPQHADATGPAPAPKPVPIHTLVPTIVPVQSPGQGTVGGLVLPPQPPPPPPGYAPSVRY